MPNGYGADAEIAIADNVQTVGAMLMIPQIISAMRFPVLENAHQSPTRMEHPPTMPTLTRSGSSRTLDSDLRQIANL
jgi:hypothetical protein